MNPRRTLQENESALRKVLTQRTLEALSKQNVAFVLEHQNDTLEQLSAYLSACMDTLGHVPAWTEVLGGDLIDLRFGGWAQALHSIGQTGYDDAQEPPRVQDTQLFRNEYDRQRVLDSFFEYGRLKSIPAQRKKERICLEEIAKELELGRPYPERELNQVLLRFHQDYCTLRRDMISEGILRREEGLYTRLV